MNSKGQVAVGSLIVLAVGIIVGLVILTGGITSPVGTLTNTQSWVNKTYTAPTTNGSANLIEFTGYQALTNVVITNASSGDVIPAANYTITNYQVGTTDGIVVSTLTANPGNSIGWFGKSINITATVEPVGYDTNSGGRAIAGLIIVFAALALVVAAVGVVIKNGGIAFG